MAVNATRTNASSTTFTVTLASLATGSARESTGIDLTSGNVLEVTIALAIKLASGSPGSDKVINIYVSGSEDGTSYGDNATGSDAGLTMRSPTNLILVKSINTPDSGALTYKSGPINVARAFGGTIPRKFNVIVENRTNLSFDSTEGNHSKTYTVVYGTAA